MTQIPADVTIPALMTGVALGGTELFEAVQTASGIGNSVKLTANQIAAFVGTSIIPLLPPQTANTFLAGPTSGAASTPAFRALVLGDLPLPSSAGQVLIGQNATTIAWESISQDLALSALGTATVTGLQGRPLLPTLPTTSQVLTWNGSAWLPTSLGASGITSIIAGTGLTGGTITGTGTISLTVPVLVSLGGTGTTTMVPSGVVLSGANATAQFSSTTVLGVSNGGIGTAAALPGGVALGGANATAPLTFTAVLPVSNGGIGTAALNPRGVVLGGANATAAVNFAPTINTAGNILIDQGTAANPVFRPIVGDVSFSILGTATITSTLSVATSITAPLIIGGTAVGSALTIESTSTVGTTDAIILKTGTQSTRMYVTSGGSVLVGNQTTGFTNALLDVNYGTVPPPAPQGGLSHIRVTAPDNGFPAFTGESFGSGNSFFTMRAASGTAGAASPLTAGHIVGSIAFEAFAGGASYNQVAAIQVTGISQQNATSGGAFIDFLPVASGTTINNPGMRLQGSGGVSVGTTLDPGAGSIIATGSETINCGTGLPTGGSTTVAYKITNVTNFGIFCGTGIPTIAAGTGSLYLRSDGVGTTTRCYINQNGSTTWTNLVTGA